jgi:alkylation response protein AidB-like acyl-CoA dehydrogenase
VADGRHARAGLDGGPLRAAARRPDPDRGHLARERAPRHRQPRLRRRGCLRAARAHVLADRPRPFFGILSACIAGVALGLGRAAIDAFSAIARDKKLPGGKKTIATRELVQVEVARAEARLGAARAYLYDTLANDGSLHARARLRLAAVTAVEAGADVTTAMFRAGGGGAVYMRSPLQRYQRDAQVVAQHIMVSSLATTTAGRVLLDLESDTSTL